MKKLITVMFLAALALPMLIQQSLNAAELQILIPLYSYPNHYNPKTYIWRKVAAAQKQVLITAIINPNNGPGIGSPNRDYLQGMKDLRAAGVTILGYVFTKYGDRSITKVKADIDIYNSYYDIDGIFLDEAASSIDKLNYYQEVYKYIKAKSKLRTVILNQGTHTHEDYLTRPAADNVVIFENYTQNWLRYQTDTYINKYNSKHFSSLIHTVPNAATMKSHIDRAVARNVGYIYITDDSPDNPDKDPWNSLPSYWQEEVNYIESVNKSTQETVNRK